MWSPCLPSYVDEILNFPNAEEIEFKKGRIDVEPPKEVMDKLMRIPYFERAYEEDGYTRSEYNLHPGLVKTARRSPEVNGRDGRVCEELPRGPLAFVMKGRK